MMMITYILILRRVDTPYNVIKIVLLSAVFFKTLRERFSSAFYPQFAAVFAPGSFLRQNLQN